MVQLRAHFLLVTFPAQGHINPALQFAKRLIRLGVGVTLATCLSAKRRMTNVSFPDGLSFVTFSDGFDDGITSQEDGDKYMSELKRRGSKSLSDLIVASENEGKPFTCLVCTILLPWAAEVARSHNLPWTLLWIQPATVLGIYYYYFHGYRDMFDMCGDPSYVIQLPGGFPRLTSRDLPSFLIPSGPFAFLLQTFQQQLDIVLEESNPKVLVNTFDELEPNALKAIDKFNVIAIGPLLPSAFLDRNDPSDVSFGGDLFRRSKEYTEWLGSKPKSSVVYISFGSLIVLPKQQMEEIAMALLKSNRPFLWVVREDTYGKQEKPEDQLNFKEELEEKGMIVPWCSQVEVLSHPSVGCFMTHCGWNSTMESLVSGVPMVAFPKWTDQATNAKLIEDVWKTGVRVVTNENGLTESEEIRRCLELVMGDGQTRERIIKNAENWKHRARETVKDGGSSDMNLRSFVEKIVGEVCL